MTFSEAELKRIERDLTRFMERRRPPVEVRGQVDLLHRIDGQSVVIYEVRPDWQDKTTKTETPIAKTTYVRTQDVWRIFWLRRDLKWHAYAPDAEVRSFAAFLAVVDRDELGCFFG